MVQYHCKALKGVCVSPYVASWAATVAMRLTRAAYSLGYHA
jgi:hypothetical protein